MITMIAFLRETLKECEEWSVEFNNARIRIRCGGHSFLPVIWRRFSRVAAPDTKVAWTDRNVCPTLVATFGLWHATNCCAFNRVTTEWCYVCSRGLLVFALPTVSL